jgi:hypothetical protein
MFSSLSRHATVITLFFFCSSSGQVLAVARDGGSIAASTVSLSGNRTLAEIARTITSQTGTELDISSFDGDSNLNVNWNKREFWNALEDLAGLVGGRWEMTPKSKAPKLIKSTNKQAPKAYVDGPFRIAVKDILIRSEFATGRTHYDLTLDVAWEPRIAVFRIDEVPHPLQGQDDGKRAIASEPIKSRNPVEGFVARSTIRLNGLTRQSKRIESLTGTFYLTAADEMLQFTMTNLEKPKSPAPQKGVNLEFQKFTKDGNYWIADVDLRYPAGGPIFESFETYWLSRNRMFLVAPGGARKFAPVDHEENGTAIRYRFKEDMVRGPVLANLKGWKLEYETPGPMREVPVKFELKEIALP